MLDADAVINNSSQKVGGSNAYPDTALKKVGGSGPRKTHRIYAPGSTGQTDRQTDRRTDGHLTYIKAHCILTMRQVKS